MQTCRVRQIKTKTKDETEAKTNRLLEECKTRQNKTIKTGQEDQVREKTKTIRQGKARQDKTRLGKSETEIKTKTETEKDKDTKTKTKTKMKMKTKMKTKTSTTLSAFKSSGTKKKVPSFHRMNNLCAGDKT
jgi:hypothetical protein